MKNLKLKKKKLLQVKQHVLVENELNELSKKVKTISTKGLTKDLISKYNILNGAKHFSLEIFQNYLVFTPDKNTLNILMALITFIRGNLMECQKEVLKI